MLMIRLQRVGKIKHPSYRLIVSEKSRDTQAGSLEILGRYNPVAKPKIIEFKADRVQHWLTRGAQPSATVHNLLVAQGIIAGKKMRVVSISQKRRSKLEQKPPAA